MKSYQTEKSVSLLMSYIEHYVCYKETRKEMERAKKETEIVVVMKNAWLWS